MQSAQRIQSLIREGNFKKAMDACEDACKKHPANPEFWLLKAAIHAQSGDLPGIVSACEQVLDLQPGHLPARYNLALALQSAGHSGQAVDHYRRILNSEPDHAPSLTNLGTICRERGQAEEALCHLEHACAVQPTFAIARNTLGLVYSDLGRHDEALTQFQTALQSQPEMVAARVNMARSQWLMGDSQAALAQLDDILGRHPAFVDAHSLKASILDDTLGVAAGLAYLQGLPDHPAIHYEIARRLAAQGQLAGAEQQYRAAIQGNPRDYQSLNNLGALLHSQGRPRDGLPYLRQALSLRPDSIQVQVNLGMAHAALGNDLDAQRHCLQALRLAPGRRDILQRFATTLSSAKTFIPGDEFLDAVLRCFEDRGIDWQNLSAPGLATLRSDPGIGGLLSRCQEASVPGYHEFAVLWQGPCRQLFFQLLAHTILADAGMERCLRAWRQALLTHFVDLDGRLRGPASDDELAAMIALARQCFNTEYVYSTEPEEGSLLGRLAGNADLDSLTGQLLQALYRPLCDAITAIDTSRLAPETAEALDELIKVQVLDARAEAAIRRELEPLTAITDGISVKVRDQYEESPYPRWLSLDLQQPRPYRSVLREHFPHFTPPDFGSGQVDTLIAGCGTGKHAILSATRFMDSQVMAIDLSRSSLAYARRNASELGIDNIDFHCADILQLGDLERRFHIIESVGVLHHLDEPERGLGVLRQLLVPGGLMNLGFYSRRARHAVYAARHHFQVDQALPDLDGIRRARDEILATPDTHPLHPLQNTLDFYSLSDCRDLLFHARETCYTLPEIRAMLERNQLDFIGFELPDAHIRLRYQARFPEDPHLNDLDRWDRFEQEQPDTFIGMYVFWCQARC